MKKLKVGIVGYGFAASTFHVPILKTIDRFEIVTVVSSNPLKVQADLPSARVVPTIDELLNEEDVELVVITTPNSLHFQMANKALQANKHVVIDKPFVVNVDEGKALISLSKQMGSVLSVYHNRRWDGDFLTLKSCIKKGVLGEIYTYESHYDRFRPEVKNRWREQNRPGSGLLYDLGPHLIDQALHLFGLPSWIMADVFDQRATSQINDYFHLVLGYETLRVILHAGSMVMEPGPRFAVHGSKGSFTKYGLDSQEEQLKSGYKPGDNGYGADSVDFYAKLKTLKEERTVATSIETLHGSYESYYLGILDAICNQATNPVSAEEALHSIEIIRCALKSSEEHRTVRLDEIFFAKKTGKL